MYKRQGESLGKDTRATISNMSQPLGNAIGNSLEVKEAIETLNGNGPEDLLELCLQAGSHMLVQAKKTDSELIARQMLEDTITSKKALHVLCAMAVSYTHLDVYKRQIYMDWYHNIRLNKHQQVCRHVDNNQSIFHLLLFE